LKPGKTLREEEEDVERGGEVVPDTLSKKSTKTLQPVGVGASRGNDT
jgi:hypothetical protein